jgi:pilus assembly protein CpaC
MRIHIVLVISLVLLVAPGWAVKGKEGDMEALPAMSAQEVPPPPMEVPEALHLMVGRSLIISSPTRIKRISIADPNIADSVLVSPYQILINGKVPGGVSLVIWDEFDQTQTFDLFVDLDIMELSRKIQEVFPEEPIAIEASKDVVILSGRATSEAVADKIFEVVSATTPKVISLMEVPTAPTRGEILLEVRFAEVDRSALAEHGVNLFSTGATNTIGTTTTGQFGGFQQQQIQDSFEVGPEPLPKVAEIFDSETTINDVLNIFLFRPDIHLGAVIRALDQQNLLQILAEPNLLTQTGKEATFLAGGEFPVPVVQGSGQGQPTVSIQFKEFGVRLNFTPTLTVDDTIQLKVAPEVSTLDFTNAVTLSGFLIPALSTRRVETEVELKDGQSFAIAGLVDNRVQEVMNKVPWLGDIPILGHLFRSRSLNKSNAELLVVVTPRIVRPSPEQPLPEEPTFPEEFLPPTDAEESNPSGETPDGG